MSAISLDRPEVISGRFETAMPEDEYHAHPALSASGMKALLRSPKYFRLSRTENRPRTEFDVGHAVHARVLGVGLPIVEIPFSLLSSNGAVSTKGAKEFVANARSEGKVPLKPATFAEVVRASDAVLTNAKARTLLEQPGFTEVSLFAEDPESGVPLRGRIDRLAGTTLIDLKSAADVRTRRITTSVVDFGYDLSAVVYRRLVELVTGEKASPMHLIFVEKDAPYEVRVVKLANPVWQLGGEAKMRAAIDLFAWCTEQGVWPGDDEDGGEIRDLPVPAWYERQMNALEEDLL
ncbi:PD-(D/E)XK nuclease-like domain-containing protein [Microbacterium sp. ZW T5_45]|uniref:PD-(D/E)XK nuclease-like domain-containing protein n=1 Tax=Microbacterium sp. ZW T5_45 TaxID=3378080 RepID=UPI0038539C8A